MTYDAIVVGVGGMGSGTLFHLARAGRKALGIEQFGIPHNLGSSHGSTRIIRLAYAEGEVYVPLLRSAYECWRELERVSGESILHLTGGLDIGTEQSATIKGSRQSCLAHGLDFEELDAAGVNRRFPGYRLPKVFKAIYQPQGGFVLSDLAVETHAKAAVDAGAELHQNERVLGWERDAEGLTVMTDAGSYRTSRLIITAGPWAGKLCADLRPLCEPERQVLLWSAPLTPRLFEPAAFPVFNMETPSGRYYGFANYQDEGFKIGKYHHLEQQVDDPDRVDRECRAEDEVVLRDAISEYFPEAGGETLKMTTCLFTNSPHGDFILDRYPGEDGVFVAAGFSGHGFKFCGVIGRIMADFCLDRPQGWDLARFTLERAREARG